MNIQIHHATKVFIWVVFVIFVQATSHLFQRSIGVCRFSIRNLVELLSSFRAAKRFVFNNYMLIHSASVKASIWPSILLHHILLNRQCDMVYRTCKSRIVQTSSFLDQNFLLLLLKHVCSLVVKLVNLIWIIDRAHLSSYVLITHHVYDTTVSLSFPTTLI